MVNIVRKDVLMTLRWIKSGEHTPGYYQLVFSLEDSKDSSYCRYVSFGFSSFDLMFVYLKNLTRAFGICFVDNLYKGKYKVTIEYEDNFNSLPLFKMLYLADDIPWPSSSGEGHFLWDFGE